MSLVILATGSATARADEVTYWNSVALDLAQETTSPPPKVSRDLAIVHSAMYDALNAIDAAYEPLYSAPTVTGPVSREAAVAALERARRLAEAMDAAVKKYGKIDVLVNNAGIFNGSCSAQSPARQGSWT